MKNEITAKFTEFNTGSNWCSGVVGNYHFEAKLFDVGSVFGIENGRVSKLSIWSEDKRAETGNFFASRIVGYDRGWDIEPTFEVKQHFNSVMELLENSPKRFK